METATVPSGVLIPLDFDNAALLAQIAADLDVTVHEAGSILLTAALIARTSD